MSLQKRNGQIAKYRSIHMQTYESQVETDWPKYSNKPPFQRSIRERKVRQLLGNVWIQPETNSSKRFEAVHATIDTDTAKQSARYVERQKQSVRNVRNSRSSTAQAECIIF